jgi:4-hydroxymandelate oxidase
MDNATPQPPCLNLHEYEAAARTVLPSAVYEFIAGGSGDEITLRASRAAFGRWQLLPRVLRGHHETSTATSVLGQHVSLPVLVAPWAAHRLCHGQGECATARAAKAVGTIFTLATPSTTAMEEVAAEAGPWWFQLYVFRDRGYTRELVARAVAAGASALVVTVDMPVFGRREADERNRFSLPPGMAFVHMPKPLSTSGATPGSVVAGTVNSIFDPALNWADLEWLASLSPLPVIAKGVLHSDDAVHAVDHGAQAVVVSNHGGRQLDSAVLALDALPRVADAVAGRAEVLVDGGVRRGTDVIKALALGARAVMIARPLAWGLAVDGEDGVCHVHHLLRTDLLRDLMLCGCPSPAEVQRALVVPVPGQRNGEDAA